MSKKNRLDVIRKTSAQMRERGFVPLDLVDTILHVQNIENAQPEGYSTKPDAMASFGMGEGSAIRAFSQALDLKQAKPDMAGVGECGTPGLGYIPYPMSNTMPVKMMRYLDALPYTRVAVEYNTDVKVGLGPRLMYHSSIFKNGALQDVCIPFQQAGKWLRGQRLEISQKIYQLNQEKAQEQKSAFVHTAPREDEKGNDTYRKALQDQLDQLDKDIAEWDSCIGEINEFHKQNNLDYIMLRCMQDDSYLDIYYPTIGLERGVPGQPWDPKIVRIGVLSACTCRLEQMDSQWQINYVYNSEKWRKDDDGRADNQKITAMPALMPNNWQMRLQRHIQSNQTTAVKKRQCWLCSPTFYPTANHPYYPIPKSFSLICSKVLDYASTLIFDKATIKQNSTMWGKMVYINLTYFKQICDAEGIDTPEKAQAKKMELQDSVNEFLKRRENNGKVLYTDSFLSMDEKQLWKAIEIVDVPQNSNVRDTKDELEEISSIILFTFGIHPSLIGATPGKTPSTGGTQQRELHLLKQIQMAPRQRLFLRFLNNVVTFNRWDSHAVYEIQMPVLTTLDRNASGIETQAQS